jgi:hypothetical protein
VLALDEARQGIPLSAILPSPLARPPPDACAPVAMHKSASADWPRQKQKRQPVSSGTRRSRMDANESETNWDRWDECFQPIAGSRTGKSSG